MTRSLPVGILALCTTALLGACTATAASGPAALDKPASTVTASTSTTPSEYGITGSPSSVQGTTAPVIQVTVTTPRSTSTVTATRTVTATPTGRGTVRASATDLAFVSPSGRIACFLAADSVECEYELADRAWTAPRAGLDCPSGSALFLDYDAPSGYCSYSPLKWDAIIDANSTQPVGLVSWWQPGDPTVTANGERLAALPYGTALVLGAYRCDSSTSGVSCANLSTGHGFFMSREKYVAY